jgi:hypothetical protein
MNTTVQSCSGSLAVRRAICFGYKTEFEISDKRIVAQNLTTMGFIP